MESTPKFFINHKTAVCSSNIEGKGLFAKEGVKKGEIIHVAEGDILTLEESKKLSEERQNLCYDVDDNHLLCPKDFNNLTVDWCINHSCNPNCGSALDWFTLTAMRNIEPNEEITYDYAMTDSEPDWSMHCHCGTKNCRKKITGNDWKITELQDKYAGYFQKNIQDKIDVMKNQMTSPQIVYEDNDVIVVNKPAGLIVHQKNAEDTQPSVVDWVIENYPELKSVGEPFIASGTKVPRAGIVHRLDKDTSGLMIVAKNSDTFFYFKNLFQEHKIKKYYLALVLGHPKNPSGVIDSPLGRIGMKRTTKIIGTKIIDKKEAVTDYKTIKKFKDYTLLEVAPKTGRTHQIRVHLNSVGLPVCGDRVYGFKKLPSPPGLNRLFLHAYRLEFKTPGGKSLILESDLPEELKGVVENLDKN